jgi:hypothetical protein
VAKALKIKAADANPTGCLQKTSSFSVEGEVAKSSGVLAISAFAISPERSLNHESVEDGEGAWTEFQGKPDGCKGFAFAKVSPCSRTRLIPSLLPSSPSGLTTVSRLWYCVKLYPETYIVAW